MHTKRYHLILVLLALLLINPEVQEDLIGQNTTLPANLNEDSIEINIITPALQRDSLTRLDTIRLWNRETFEETIMLRRSLESTFDHYTHCLGIADISRLLIDHSVLVKDHRSRNACVISWNMEDERIDTLGILSRTGKVQPQNPLTPAPK